MKTIKSCRIIDTAKREVTDFRSMFERLKQKVILGGLSDSTLLNYGRCIAKISLHFLPKGFSRIRHYGILSSAWNQRVFAHLPKKEKINWEDFWKNKGFDVNQCPHCKKGQLIYICKTDPVRGPPVYTEIKMTVLI